MTCENLRDLLPLAAGGETTENERIAVEGHAAVCAACARELAEYRELRALVAGLRDGVEPPGTFQRIQEAVLPPVRRSRPAFLAWAGRAAAVLAIGLSIGYTVQSLSRRAPEIARPADDADATYVPPATPAGAGAGPSMFMNGGPEVTIRFDNVPMKAAPRDGTYYLPRVESLVNPDEVDF